MLRKRDRSRKIAQTEIEDSKISSLNRLPEAILSLKSGKVAGVVVEKPVGEGIFKTKFRTNIFKD